MLTDPLLVIAIITLLLFGMDLVGKLINDMSIESIGADLCMLALSFNVTTILMGEVLDLKERDDFQQLISVSMILLFGILIVWLISLRLVKKKWVVGRERNWFHAYRFDFFVTMIFGLSALFSQFYFIHQLLR